MSVRTLSLFAISLLLPIAASAHEYEARDLRIAHPHARASVPGQPTGAAYLGLENGGKTADRLLGASTPMAKSVEMHTMSMDKNVMRMREVSDITIAPGAKISMQPGNGYHLMLIGLTRPLKPGDKFPITLRFEKFGPLEVSVSVDDPAAKSVQPSKPAPAATTEHRH